MLLSDKKDTLEIRQQVLELFHLEQRFKSIKKTYEDTKNKLNMSIKNYMYCNSVNDSSIQFYANTNGKDEKLIEVKKIEPASIIWDADKLEKKLNKQQKEYVINKTYTITDMTGLIEYLKACGVNPKRFKSFIQVSKAVNVEHIEQLYEIGELEQKEVEGCYTIEHKNSYLRIKMGKPEE